MAKGQVSEEPCRFLPWDTDFFGLRIARVAGRRLTEDDVEAVLAWCDAHAIECVYFLADADDATTTRLAEQNGFDLVDVRVTLECDVRQAQYAPEPQEPARTSVRVARPSDIPALKAIARACHTDTRFYFDPHFPRDRCDAFYETWIEQSCGDYADVVLVAQIDDQPRGYMTCNIDADSSSGAIGLVGIDSGFRGQGAGRLLVADALRWFKEQGCNAVTVPTQGRNSDAQRLYQRNGFVTRSIQLWYHKWFVNTGT